VLYYRNGVSTSQYVEVISKELNDIAKAFALVAQRAKVKVLDFKLTAVIVTKRHSTRFFPTKTGDAQNNNGNTKPGTWSIASSQAHTIQTFTSSPTTASRVPRVQPITSSYATKWT
jgi:hypothetical protein